MTDPDRPLAELGYLRTMREIRVFEDEVQRLFTAGPGPRLDAPLPGPGGGRRSARAARCATGDTMTCTYRGHGAVLAMGAPLDRAFGEILGKADGLCGGKGGSMHLTDVSVGALGSFAIVGAPPADRRPASRSPRRYRGTDEVTLCFFGDGATNIGAFHEALNLAAIWKLPVLFVCENNLYGEYSPLADDDAGRAARRPRRRVRDGRRASTATTCWRCTRGRRRGGRSARAPARARRSSRR